MSGDKQIVKADGSSALIDRFRYQFETAFRSGNDPTIEEFLAEVAADQRSLILPELLRLDQRFRVAANENPTVEDYVRRFPDMESVIRTTFSDSPVAATDRETAGVAQSAVETDEKTIVRPSHEEDCEITLPPDARPASPFSATDHDVTLPPKTPWAGTSDHEVTLPPGGDPEVTIPPDMDAEGTIPPDGAGQQLPGDTKIRDFGDYELLQEIARGGMGVVFKARHSKLHRIVALKMILAGQLADEKEVQRFYAEAEAAANLDHPGIVPIHQVGDHEGQHYFSMGYVEGASLQAKLMEGPLPPNEAAEMTAKIADAVHHAHQHGVIHRDLKPSNVLLDEAGHPRVTDFGLAKQVQGDSNLTATGQVLGTPSYMPPEQAAGQLDEVNEASDVYSLGGVFYALLTGRPPFQAGSAVDTLMQVMEKDPVNPSQLNAAIPIDLETICLKCLQKEPERRYSTAAEMSADINRYLNGEPILARPVSRIEKTWKWCRRNAAVSFLLATCAMLLLTGTVVSTVFWWQAHQSARRAQHSAQMAREKQQLAIKQEEIAKNNEAIAKKQSVLAAARREEAETQREEAETQRDEANRQRALAQEQLERAEWLLYANQIKLAQMEWNYGDPTIAREALDSCRLSFRGWEHDYLHSEITRNQRTFQGHSNAVRDVVFSPDGKRIASGSWDNTVKIWDVESGQVIHTLRGHNNDILAVSFSPDGSRVASSSRDGTVRIWDVQSESSRGGGFASGFFDSVAKLLRGGESRQLIRTLRGHRAQVHCVSFSPDGSLIASGSTDETLRLWNAKTGENVLTLRQQTTVSSLAFSSDGKRIVSGSADYTGTTGDVRIWNIETGENTHILRGHTEAVHSVDFSPDGTLVVSASHRENYPSPGDIRIWNAETGDPIRTFAANVGGVFKVAFSRDGERIASANGDRTIKIWETSTGLEILTLKGHTRIVRAANFSPNGKQIVSGSWDNTIKVWEVEPREEATVLRGHRHRVLDLATSADGKWIASVSQDNTVRIWDAETGLAHYVLVGHIGSVLGVDFSPNGQQIVSGSQDRTIRIWNTSSGFQERILTGHGEAVNCVAFSPDGRHIASGSVDKTVMVWDAKTGQSVLTLAGHTGSVRDLQFSPDGKQLVSVSHDELAKIWDTETGAERRTLQGHRDAIQCVSFSPNGKYVVTGSRDKTVMVWDIDTGQVIHTLKGHTDAVWDVSVSPDGKRIVSGSYEGLGNPGELKVWDFVSGQELLGQNTDGLCLNFSSDGKRILSGGVDGTIRIWDASKRQDTHALKGHTNGIYRLAISRDGRRIASASRDNTIRIWDADTGAEKLNLHGHSRGVRSVTFSPDGKHVLSAGGDHIIKVWDANTGKEHLSIDGHSRVIFGVAFSPDGQRIVSGGADNQLRVWDATTGAETMTLAGHTDVIRSVAVSPDGQLFASGSVDQLIKVWDANTGEEMKTLKGHDGRVLSVSFSPDGKRIVSAADDQMIRIWNTESGDEELTLVGHSGAVRSASFSTDGKHVVSGSTDKTIKVWNAETGEEVVTRANHSDVIHDVRFSPNGRSLISGGNDATVRIWNMPELAEGAPQGVDSPSVSAVADKPARTANSSRLDMPVTSMVYWTDRRIPGICRVNLDGSYAQSIVWNLGEPRGLLLHDNTDLYYCDYELGQIGRTDLAGTTKQIVIPATPGVRGVTIDARSNKIYWTDRELRKVFRANLDGSDVEELMSDGLAYPYAIQIDPVDDKLYVEDHDASGIYRSNLDGSQRETFVAISSQGRVGGMVIDVEGRTLYFKDSSGSRIMRIGVDDDKPEVVLTAAGDVLGLTINNANRKLYWADSAIRRANLDGTQIETVFETTLGSVKSIAIYHPPSSEADSSPVPTSNDERSAQEK